MRPAIVCRAAAIVALLLCGALPARAQTCPDQPASPTLSPAGGVFATASVSVSLTTQPGTFLSYTTDGTTPPPGASSTPVTLTRTTTLTAVAWCYQSSTGQWRYSPAVSATYTLKVGTPVLSRVPGTYGIGTMIQVTSDTPAASLRYRLDGVDPVDTDPEVPTGGVLMAGGFSLKVRGFYRTMDPSDVASVTYATPSGYTAGAMAAGRVHSLALTPDGGIWTWGANNLRQLGYGERAQLNGWTWTWDGSLVVQQATSPQRKTVTGARMVASGDDFSIALREDGSVWTWGSNTSNALGRTTCETGYTSPGGCIRPGPITSLSTIVAVAAGAAHGLALAANGTVWAWGDNSNGQLGDGTTTSRSAPATVPGLTNVTAIAAGSYYSLALTANGTVWGWGDNDIGQLGNGGWTDRTSPVQTSGLSGVAAIAAGYAHSLAVKADGTLWAWGQNNSGQLGDGSLNFRLTPASVLTGVTTAAAGRSHTLALKTDGTLWSWGTNAAGQLGDPAIVGQRTTPAAVPNLPALRRVEAWDHSLAIGTDGSGWSWGLNSYGQVGNGVTSSDVRTPYQVFAPGTFGCSPTTVTPASLTVPSGAGAAFYDVTIAWDCDWTATSDSTWAQPGAGRTGSGSVTISVPVNPGAPRTATLTIAGKTVTLTQEGYAIVPSTNEEISYMHTDAIGSVRMITNATGAVVARYDYLPFGTEWGTTSTFANDVKFGGGERDAETAAGAWGSLDYFGARNFQSQTGRFMSVDPGHVGGDVMDPQSWNGYAYARNNPFRFVDPTGTDYYITIDGGDSFWFDHGFGDFAALRRYLTDQGFSAFGDDESGYILNAAGREVGTYRYSSRSARLFGEIGRRAGPAVNGIAVATGIVLGGVTGFGFASGGLVASSEWLWLGAASRFGNIVGWGTGQAGAAVTRHAAQRLTRDAVKQMIRRGLTRSEVQRQLATYQRAVAQGGPKLANTQLMPRIELLQRILQLWP